MRKDLPVTYIKDGYEVEITPYFLYEISIYKLAKNSAELIASKYVKSDKPLEFKHSEYSSYDRKHPPEYRYAKFIDWLGAPESYIRENKFKLVEPIVKKKKIKK